MATTARLADVVVRVPLVCELADGSRVSSDELAVSVDGPSDVRELALRPTSGAGAEISFVTAIAGAYVVRARHGEQGAEVRDMPIIVHVHRSDESAPPSRAPAPEPAPEAEAEEEQQGRLIRFKIPGQAALGIDALSVQLVEGPAPIVGAQVETLGADLSVLLTLTQPGAYKVGVLHRGQALPHSPFTITVPPKAFQ
jgi:hypothetical protein